MIDVSFGYANSRVKAMKSKLLDSEAIRSLFSVSTLDEFIDMLENTRYKPAFVEASTKQQGISLVMTALRLDFDSDLSEIIGLVPRSSRPKAEALLARWQLKALQAILASKAASIPLDPSFMTFLDSKSRENVSLVAQAPNFTSALMTLSRIGYEEISSKALAAYGKTKDYRVALRLIDKYYYEDIAKALSGKNEEREVGIILGSELEFYNVTTALRMKNAGMPEQAILRELIGSRGSNSVEGQVAAAPGIADAVELAGARLGLADLAAAYLRAGSLPDVELELEKRMYSKILSATRVSVLSLGAVLGYFYLKRREVENLRAIALSLQFPSKEELQKNVYALGA